MSSGSSIVKHHHILSEDELNNLASKNLDEMREIAARICRDYLTGAWKMITADDIQLKRISGGLSNFLYYVSLPDNLDNNNERNHVKRLRKEASRHLTSEPKEVLLRIYGQMHGEQAMDSVLTDTVVFTLLSERKLGPKLHGIFPGGRIEQYIPARPLTTHELSEPRISAKIAEKMAAIHSLSIPVSKEPEWLWKTMDRWLANSDAILANYAAATSYEAGLCEDMRSFDFRAEVDWLRATIEAEDFAVVFSHNDMQEGNILFREEVPGGGGGGGGGGVGGRPMEAQQQQPEEEEEEVEEDEGACCAPHERIDLANGNSNSGSNSTTNTISSSSNTSATTATSRQLQRGAAAVAFDGSDDTYTTTIGCDDLGASRKRSFSLHAEDLDPDNTRDSVLSDNSGQFCEALDDPALMIIDFEYCAYNYRGFDVANHFVEWTMDYTNAAFPFYEHRIDQYPSREQQEQFIGAYLRAMEAARSGECSARSAASSTASQASCGSGSAAGGGGNVVYVPSAAEIDELLDEVRCFRMVSHLFWTLWAIVNVHQEIEFGYWDYGLCRLKAYLSAKEEYTKAKGLCLKRKHTLDKRQCANSQEQHQHQQQHQQQPEPEPRNPQLQ